MKSIISQISLVAVILLSSSCQSSAQQEKLNPHAFQAKMKELKNEVVIDVRTPQEYKGGHIENAKNINWNGNDFAEQVSKLDKDKPVMVYCMAGGRSAAAANELKKIGFKNVIDLEGGMTNWRANGLPEETGEKKTTK